MIVVSVFAFKNYRWYYNVSMLFEKIFFFSFSFTHGGIVVLREVHNYIYSICS